MSNTPLIKPRIIPCPSQIKSTDSIVSNSQQNPIQSKIKSKIKINRIFTLSSFIHLIVITSVMFCAGGFGFGVALRYGQTWQNDNVFATDNSPTSDHNYQ